MRRAISVIEAPSKPNSKKTSEAAVMMDSRLASVLTRMVMSPLLYEGAEYCLT